jgi:class 3 adenylate cyclase/predicted ATPase
MTFKDVLAQVIDWLQQDKRITYRALKRQFDLDDEYLEDLKAELIQAKKLAVDEDGAVLIWAGASAISEPTSPPAQPTQQPAAQEQASSQLTPRSPAPPPDAERRQLTVMFCDLVDSTRLSSQLDPEEYRDVVRAYQSVCTEVIIRFDGYVAQLLGDGLLVYFGYPHAHEDDPQRAVRTGLGILAAMGDLHTRLKQEKGIQLAVRVGIHTGVVVVGEMGGGGRQEQLALGEVPNVASRIQGLAEPNTIVISAATYRLVQGYFECQELGAQTLRGVSQPIAVYRVLQVSGAQSRLDVASTRGFTPLVGRESEVTFLLERWQQVNERQGQVILLSGEGGIGKSRLVQVVKEHVAHEPHVRWECRSSPYYQNTPLYPLVDLIQRTLQWQQEGTADEKLEQLEHILSHYRLPLAESVPLFAPLLSLYVPEHRYPPLNLSPQRQRQKTLESLVTILLELAKREPVLFILEDLHWTDPTTLEFLGLLLDHISTVPIYVLLTCRPEFQPSWHHGASLTEVTVNRLSREQITRMAAHVAGGKQLPAEVLQQIVEKTDGVPLFVEEMVKAVLESGYMQEVDGQYELEGALPSFTIPATLHDSLMARLDRLVSARSIAQLGAVIGRQFAYDVLHAVLQLDNLTLQRELGRLVEAELVYQHGLPPQATYTFKHALIQDAAYQSLLKSTRLHYHQQIAQVLEKQFPEMAATQPELLAHHYTEAGRTEQAVGYLHRAGQKAIARSANVEAISHLTTGLELLQTLPDTPARAQHELAMQITLGGPLLATKGYAAPEVEHVYTRALALCQQTGDPLQRSSALLGLWRFYIVRAAYQKTHALAEQLLSLAQSTHDSSLFVLAHYTMGWTWFNVGEIARAWGHLEESTVLYASDQRHAVAFRSGQDPGVACRSFATLALWILGYPDRARTSSHEALRLAQDLGHPFSLAFAWIWAAAIPHQLRREALQAQARAATAVAFSTEQGFALLEAWGTMLQGWALAAQGRSEEGITQMHQGFATHRTTGAEALQPYFLALLAEAYGQVGRLEQGLCLVAEALVAVDNFGEQFYAAELYRLKGVLLLQQSSDNQAEAESCFQQAITIAQNQQAKSFELRTATSLARLWQQQGKREKARLVLGDIYNWFTEGFDTADLKDAKALLDALA